MFGNLVNEHLPSFQDEDADSSEGVGGTDSLPNGHARVPSDATKAAQGLTSPLFPEVDPLLSLFKDSCKELVDLRQQVHAQKLGLGTIFSLLNCLLIFFLFACHGLKVDARLDNLKKEVQVQDSKHRKTLSEVSVLYMKKKW